MYGQIRLGIVIYLVLYEMYFPNVVYQNKLYVFFLFSMLCTRTWSVTRGEVVTVYLHYGFYRMQLVLTTGCNFQNVASHALLPKRKGHRTLLIQQFNKQNITTVLFIKLLFTYTTTNIMCLKLVRKFACQSYNCQINRVRDIS